MYVEVKYPPGKPKDLINHSNNALNLLNFAHNIYIWLSGVHRISPVAFLMVDTFHGKKDKVHTQVVAGITVYNADSHT